MKAELTKNAVLFAPDLSREFIDEIYASLTNAWVVLTQISEGEKHPVCVS